ncbi:MAG: glycosyltransferase [Pseudomonadota bacterium]
MYVHALVGQLQDMGVSSSVAAPGATSDEYEHHGVRVHRFAVGTQRPQDMAHGFADEVAAAEFERLVKRLRPQIVHFHARTSAVSELLMEIGREADAGTVFTYHTPAASCARGSMMLFGAEPCDGRIDQHRCTACTCAALGMPRILAATCATVPNLLAAPLAVLPAHPGPLSRLNIPRLISEGSGLFRKFVDQADHTIAVCDWVRQVLMINGVSPDKITVCRQGLSSDLVTGEPPVVMQKSEEFRIAYFGRIDSAKGLETLTSALARCNNSNVSLTIHGVLQDGHEELNDKLKGLSQSDTRLRILPSVAHENVVKTMAKYDLIAVPSQVLETGPLVVLEAFAARVPVLGSNLGGIAELVRHDVDGLLIEPANVDAWNRAITFLASNPSYVERLRSNIVPPRTMVECANDMFAVYTAIVDKAVARSC